MNVLALFDGMSCGQLALQRAGIKYDNYFASEIDKFSMKVTQENFPDTIQLGDVRNVFSKDLPQIDLLIGGSPCFTANNFVFTIDGYKPIQDIVVGDLVLTHNNRYCKVLRTGSDEKETLKIKSQGSTEITTTYEHPFYCITNNLKEYSKPYWKKIIDFKICDKVISLKINKEINLLEFSDIDLYILGRFLADGCCFKVKRKNRKNSYIYIYV